MRENCLLAFVEWIFREQCSAEASALICDRLAEIREHACLHGNFIEPVALTVAGGLIVHLLQSYHIRFVFVYQLRVWLRLVAGILSALSDVHGHDPEGDSLLSIQIRYAQQAERSYN